MTSNIATTSPSPRQPVQGDDLLLRETNHRCSNDLQLVVSLLTLQSRRVTNPEARDALTDATSRVAVLARARAELSQQRQASLQTALRQVCEALHSLAETRSILISLEAEQDVQGLTSNDVATLALVVNGYHRSGLQTYVCNRKYNMGNLYCSAVRKETVSSVGHRQVASLSQALCPALVHLSGLT